MAGRNPKRPIAVLMRIAGDVTAPDIDALVNSENMRGLPDFVAGSET
jgi:hypothetical protein